MVHSAEGLLLVHLYLILRQSNGGTCPLYLCLGICLYEDLIKNVKTIVEEHLLVLCIWLVFLFLGIWEPKHICANIYLFDFSFCYLSFFFLSFCCNKCVISKKKKAIVFMLFQMVKAVFSNCWIPSRWWLVTTMKWDIMGLNLVLYWLQVNIVV